ncbi:hypothetical protein BZL30_5148 [Mycobacterium kansasii]|uniref:Uncharacterized protein n=1 Tax=Mycobacterium kansasii TaxID=1768 RepID=A0A1V3X472_MYCKA|nr:hypothetical protein BZL30_5148 [Mycobacterium kansasii]
MASVGSRILATCVRRSARRRAIWAAYWFGNGGMAKWRNH